MSLHDEVADISFRGLFKKNSLTPQISKKCQMERALCRSNLQHRAHWLISGKRLKKSLDTFYKVFK